MARLIFANANLLDGNHPAQPGATVVVEDDRIVSVDPVASVESHPDDRVLDLAGRTLMPGMVSCHFHATYHELGAKPAPFGLEEPPALQAVRAVRNLEGVLQRRFHVGGERRCTLRHRSGHAAGHRRGRRRRASLRPW